MDVAADRCHIHRQVGQKIHLGDQHHIRVAEHQGVLERLVIALGHAEQRHFVVFPNVKFRRADKVAHVLHEQ